MKRKILIAIIGLVVLIAVAFPSIKWMQAEAANKLVSKQQELLLVQNSFFGTYGSTVKVNTVIPPESLRMYAVTWADDKYAHTSLFVNGTWVEIARADLQTIVPTPAPIP